METTLRETLTLMLGAYRQGERGLPTYDELMTALAATTLLPAPPAATPARESTDAADLFTKQGKLLALADRIDHEKLWRMAGMDHHKLTDEQKDRMNAAVALRRYADIWTPGHWVIVPPTGGIQFGASTLEKAVEMTKRDQARREAAIAHHLTAPHGESDKTATHNNEKGN